jgi:hypothetical protein
MYLKDWVSFQIFRPCELHGYVCITPISSKVKHQMESPLSSFPVERIHCVQHSGMAAQYIKKAMRDVIPSYAGCHPKLCGMSSRQGIEKVNIMKTFYRIMVISKTFARLVHSLSNTRCAINRIAFRDVECPIILHVEEVYKSIIPLIFKTQNT